MSKGRQRDPELEAYWRRMLDRHRRSGLSVRGFCVSQGLRASACHAWRRIIRQRDLEKQRSGDGLAGSFVPVVVADGRAGEDSRMSITIELRDGRAMRLPASMSPEQLAAVIGAIENLSRPEAA